jgi:protein ImuB
MRLAEATTFAELETRTHQSDEDLEALCSLAERAQQFSPLIGIETLDRRVWAGRTLHQPECLLLDVTGLADLFAGYENLLAQLSGWLRSQGYFACLAIANSVGAAWAIANYALRSPSKHSPNKDGSADNSLATAASQSANSQADPLACQAQDADHENTPDQALPICRSLLIDPQDQWPLIKQLPLAALRIDDTTHATLRKLGLRTIGQLSALPRAGLASRLDQQVLKRCDQVDGRCDEPIIALHGLPEWNVEQELEYPTEHTETISELLRRGLNQLTLGLDKRGEGALRIVCRLDLVEHTPLILQLSLYRPTSDPVHLNLLASSLIEQQLPRQMKAPLWRLSVQATLTAPLVWRQGDLFHASQAAHRQQMAGLVDMLSARLGRKQVLRAANIGESQPELAYEFKPLTGLRPDGSAQDTVRKLASRQSNNTVEPSRADPLRRPAQLLQPPVPIEATGSLAQAQSITADQPAATAIASAPASIKTANGWHRVMGAVGPERLESGWWKGQSCRRDYYRIITHLGAWWWIYRDLTTGQWYLHGLFD